ncbi:MAG: dynamin family protein [Clostridiaceae bacterium]
MIIIRLGCSDKATESIKEYKDDIIKMNVIFILNEDIPLFEFIENLTLDGNLLYNLRIANEVDFIKIPMALEDKFNDEQIGSKISSLSEMLEHINENDFKNYRAVFDTDDKNFISKINQALIYLEIELEVMMKKEKKDRMILDAFRKQYESMRYSVEKDAQKLQLTEVADEFANEKNEYVEVLFEIEEDLEKARERELKIAVMATKKAGKSVIVNSFLREQYAPTSLELPTPNNCIYKRSKDNTLRLIYGENSILFRNPKDIYLYLLKEFKKAQIDKASGYTLGDMEIQYVGTGNNIGNYTIIDTPGSNYVPAKKYESSDNRHKKLAYKWIEIADVVLFLINYSNYLTMDEEEFFRDVKKQFENMNKFYSLIVVVNKLDEMYISEFENKSVVRFLDYIRYMLYELGYKGFVVIGTSARTYFDSLRVEKLDEESSCKIKDYVPIKTLKGDMLRKRMKILKNLYVGMPEMSVLSFADDQLANLEWFHGFKDYSLDDLYKKSGIPNLERYTVYIAMQKANLELYSEIIRDIDEKYVKISNKSKINKMTTSRYENLEQIKEIGDMIQQISERFGIIKNDISGKLNFQGFQEKLFSEIKFEMDQILDHMLDIGEARIDEYFMKLLLKPSEELKNIKSRTLEIEFSINNKLFASEIKEMIKKPVDLLNEEVYNKEVLIKKAESHMKDIVENFSYIVRREYKLRDFNITVPKMDQEFKNSIILNMPELDINDNTIKEKIYESIEFKASATQNIFNSFRKEKQGTYCINSQKLRKINKDYIEQLRNGEYSQFYDALIVMLSKSMDENSRYLFEVFKNILSVYENILSDILKSMDLIKEKSEKEVFVLDNYLEFYSGVEEQIHDFSENWEAVRSSGA